MSEPPDTDGTLRVTVDADGEATLDAAREAASAVAVRETGPVGVAALDPLCLATRDGRTAFHPRASPDRVETLLATLEDGGVPTEGASAVVDHAADASALPLPAEGPLAVGDRQVLGRCGWVDPTVPPAERASDRAATDPASVRDRVESVGVLGRGRADAATDAPVAGAWERAHAADGDPAVVVSGHEADPLVDGDRLLLSGAASEVLDGALAVAGAVGATDVVVVVPDDRAGDRVERAAGTFDAGIDVVAGPDSFLAGEPTVALEALEGSDRLEARRTPPGPAEYGLYGRPTVLHTPRTAAAVRAAVLGDVPGRDAADPGTRLVTVGGDVAAPATVELPTDVPLSRALAAVEGDGAGLFCVGGRFGGLTRSLDVPASAPALSGADLGTNGAVEVLGEGRCPVAAAGERARFAREENCGRCVPCREGSVQVHELLREVYEGRFPDDELRELGRTMRATSACGFGVAAARPVLTAIEEFERAFRAHAEGRCPAGECEPEVEP